MYAEILLLPNKVLSNEFIHSIADFYQLFPCQTNDYFARRLK